METLSILWFSFDCPPIFLVLFAVTAVKFIIPPAVSLSFR